MNVFQVQKLLSLVGSQWGLSLLINVEQYENIKGLNTDAGVKVSEFIKFIYQRKYLSYGHTDLENLLSMYHIDLLMRIYQNSNVSILDTSER